MWISFVIVASFVVAVVAMAYFGIQSHDERQRREATEGRAGEPAGAACCGLCNAPLPRRATTDEVVFEVEHRIEAERGEIARAWQASPGALGRALSA